MIYTNCVRLVFSFQFIDSIEKDPLKKYFIDSKNIDDIIMNPRDLNNLRIIR